MQRRVIDSDGFVVAEYAPLKPRFPPALAEADFCARQMEEAEIARNAPRETVSVLTKL
jgi:hypothetical protein